MTRLSCARHLLDETLERLRDGGRVKEERVVLWLAVANARNPIRIEAVLEPEQQCAKDRFHLPPRSMTAIMMRLRTDRLKIAAQIHTHPGRAYHSDVDAEWAIIRHVGAISLVLPRFALATTVDTFLDQVRAYEQTAEGDWALVPNRGRNAWLEFTS